MRQKLLLFKSLLYILKKEKKKEEEKEEKKPGKKINVEACDKAARDFLCHVFGAMGMEVYGVSFL